MTELTYNRVSLSASAEKEVQHDQLSITFQATCANTQAIVVQDTLKEALAKALEVVLPHKKGNAVAIDPGALRVSPRYDVKGKMTGYQGSVELTVYGTDTKTVASFTNMVTTMVVANTQFSVSRQKRQRYERDLTREAIKAFRQRAQEVAEAFAGLTYEIVEVSVSSGGGGHRHYRGAAMPAAISTAASSPMMDEAAGKEVLQASVSGTIEFSK